MGEFVGGVGRHQIDVPARQAQHRHTVIFEPGRDGIADESAGADHNDTRG